jgi:hypothetical protein
MVVVMSGDDDAPPRSLRRRLSVAPVVIELDDEDEEIVDAKDATHTIHLSNDSDFED